MQEATFMILTALADGSQHGYGIIGEVAEISHGRVKLRAGTLYTALDRLRADGLVDVDREEVVDNRLRRYYRLTSDGTARLAAEAARLHANATAAFTRLNPAAGPALFGLGRLGHQRSSASPTPGPSTACRISRGRLSSTLSLSPGVAS
jgi:DNA-binding PadR family transcriptional regulator